MKQFDIERKPNPFIVFKGKNIRRIIHHNEWWFSVVDIVGVLTESNRARKYWSELKIKLEEEGYVEVSDKIGQLKLESPDGKMRLTDCANTETLFRIIQSIPSKKAELFKRWLAKVGYERIQEIDDPDLATKRTRAMYLALGYPENWVARRMQGMATRAELTNYWDEHDIENKEYAYLTAEIVKATFGMTPSEYQDFKNIEDKNLRDNMDTLELLFTQVGEEATKRIAETDNAKGYKENKKSAEYGGKIASDARIALEKKTRRKVSTKKNKLHLINKTKSVK